MTADHTPTRLERLQSVNRSIGKIDRVADDINAMLAKSEKN